MLPTRAQDPRDLAPVGCYLRDQLKTRIVEVLEADWSGVVAEDLLTSEWLDIERIELAQKWCRVRPDGLGGVRERAARAAVEGEASAA